MAYDQMIAEKRMRNIEAMQTEIGLWHIETFGTDCHNKRLARKLLEEAAEFMCSQSSWATPEAADVLIVLMAWAHRNNVDLLKAVEDKFEIVRERDQKARDNA